MHVQLGVQAERCLSEIPVKISQLNPPPALGETFETEFRSRSRARCHLFTDFCESLGMNRTVLSVAGVSLCFDKRTALLV